MEKQRASTIEFSFDIKPLSTITIPSLVSIDSSVSSYPWNLSQFTDEYNRIGTYSVTAETSREEVIGFTLGRSIADEHEITRIAVVNAYQRRGIGTRLIQAIRALCEQALPNNALHIYLEVGRDNSAAKKIYEKSEFLTQYTRRKYYTNNDDDALVMSLELR